MYSKLMMIIFQLIQLLGNSKYGNSAAQGFAVVMQDYADVMSKVMHANIRLMYRQRFFIEHLPNILQGYQSASSGKYMHSLVLGTSFYK